MGIKTRTKISIVSLFICCLLFPAVTRFSVTGDNDPSVKTSAPEFPDKVYAFLAPSDTLTFDNLYLEKALTYLIWVEIVTPHNCSLVITLWDPDGKRFDIYESDLTATHAETDFDEIPFGCAITGNHTIEFLSTSEYNHNIYIRIEKWVPCLYDKLNTNELQNMILYNVTRFHNGMVISPTVELKTDYMYRFCFGRVSPIAATVSDFVSVNFTLYDPNTVDYILYTNETLASIFDVSRIFFGTAIGDIYTLDVEVKSDVAYTNIAYVIIELYKISGVNDPNQTDPTNSTSSPTNRFQMPIGWTTGIIVFFGVIITPIVIIVVKNKNKNVASFTKRIQDENQD